MERPAKRFKGLGIRSWSLLFFLLESLGFLSSIRFEVRVLGLWDLGFRVLKFGILGFTLAGFRV